jgi:hypothetical protein
VAVSSNSKSLSEFLTEISSLNETPDKDTFVSHHDFVPAVINALKNGHEMLKSVDLLTVNPSDIPDAFTVSTTVYGSGFNGNSLLEPEAIIDKIVNNLAETFSKMIWLSIYENYKDATFPAEVDKQVFFLFKLFRLNRRAKFMLKNNTSFKELIQDQHGYEVLESMIRSGLNIKWYMSSNAGLQVCTIKRYDGQYFINQRDYGLRADGIPHQIFEEDLVYDEWLDDIKDINGDDNHSKIFVGDLRYTLGFSISNSMLIERTPVMVTSSGKSKPRKLSETEPDGEFIPGIQYNITMKVKPFTTSYRQPWLILDVDYK